MAAPEDIGKGNNRADRVRITSDRLLFKYLLDTPDSYEGRAGQTLRINSSETGLEYGLPYDSTSLVLRASHIEVTPEGNLESTNVQDALEELQADIDAIPVTPPVPLVRYTVSDILNDEVYVVATNYGITYQRLAGTGTFTIPAGVLLTSVSMHIDTAATGTTFTIVYGDLGSNGALNNDVSNYIFPMADALLELNGLRVGITTARPSGYFDRIELRNLVGSSKHHIKLLF